MGDDVVSSDPQAGIPPRALRDRVSSAGKGARVHALRASDALVEAVGGLADRAIDRVLLTGEPVTSAAPGTETGGGQPGARTSSCSRQSAGPWLRAFSPRGPAVPLPTCYFARHWRELRGLFDRVELFNGRQLFGWVAEEGLRVGPCS